MKHTVILITLLNSMHSVISMDHNTVQNPLEQEATPFLADYFYYPSDYVPDEVDVPVNTSHMILQHIVHAATPSMQNTPHAFSPDELRQYLFKTDTQQQSIDYATARKTVLGIYNSALLTASCIKKLTSVCQSLADNAGINYQDKSDLFRLALARDQSLRMQEQAHYPNEHVSLFTKWLESQVRLNTTSDNPEFQILKPSDFIADDLD